VLVGSFFVLCFLTKWPNVLKMFFASLEKWVCPWVWRLQRLFSRSWTHQNWSKLNQWWGLARSFPLAQRFRGSNPGFDKATTSIYFRAPWVVFSAIDYNATEGADQMYVLAVPELFTIPGKCSWLWTSGYEPETLTFSGRASNPWLTCAHFTHFKMYFIVKFTNRQKLKIHIS